MSQPTVRSNVLSTEVQRGLLGFIAATVLLAFIVAYPVIFSTTPFDAQMDQWSDILIR